MPSYKNALSILLLLASQQGAESFQHSFSQPSIMHSRTQRASSILSSFSDDPSQLNKLAMPSLGDKVRTVKVAYIDDGQDEEEIGIGEANRTMRANRKMRVVMDVKDGMQTFAYNVDLPIVDIGTKNKTGLSLREVKEGTVSENCLEIDFLRYVSLEQEVMRNQKKECTFGEMGNDGSIQTLNEEEVDGGLNGIIVSSVVRGELAWDLGIRAGDMMVATSATIGDKLWPKSTMEGVRSAISSRRVLSKTIETQFKRASEVVGESELVQEFEMSLSRPMGIHIEDTTDGYVQISGFTDDAPDRVTKQLRLGDRIIAVDSSLGRKMWPVSSIEGVVSAVTTRLPGQPVQIRFERLVEEGTNLSEVEALGSAVGETKADENKKKLSDSLRESYSRIANEATIVQSEDLLSRCRGVLKRYISVHDSTCAQTSNVPALVADRVMESLAGASASLDAKTLSLVMNAYITCNQPENALKTFEVAVGLKADGSEGTPEGITSAKKANTVIPSKSGLNLITVTDVIRAHAMMRNSFAARRVLAAIDGDINGIESFSWSDKIQADTKCYNTILTAMVNSNDIENADKLFDQMCDSNRLPTKYPKKNLVTYNIMIGVYARFGRREDAFDVFNAMRGTGLAPDKFTITALIKAVVKDGDFDVARTLLQDMKKAGIDADVVAYNTVIGALCQRSSWFEAKELVAEMESIGINPDSKTYGLLMNGLLKLKKPGPCLTLFESACADQRTAGLMENVQLYTTAITAAASLGDSDRAFELISRMNFAGVKPNMKTLTALISACVSDNKHAYAIDVFKKIKSPDGYAQALAIRAYCGLDDFNAALNMMQSSDKMKGKQIMLSYNYMIGSALSKKYYNSAQMIMDDLLRRGFIPSKKTLQIITLNLNLFQKKGSSKAASEEGNEKFTFLLSVLDSFDKRKLQFSGQFYAGMLFEGARLGGLEKKIASLISQSKIDASHLNVHIDDVKSNTKAKRSVSWTDFLQEYSQFRDHLDEIVLPAVRVKATEGEIRQVLVAERGVAYGRSRERKRQTRTTLVR